MLLPCKECGNLISNLATMCPHCGYSENGLVEQNATMPIKYEEGHYKIGIDMPAGEYSLQCIDANSLGFYIISTDANGKNIVAIENFKRNSYVDIKDGQYFRINNCVAVPTNIKPVDLKTAENDISPKAGINKNFQSRPIEALFSIYDSIVLVDLETTGLDKERDEIIELAALKVELVDGKLVETDSMDDFIKIEKKIPENIVKLTGITDEILVAEGIGWKECYDKISRFFFGYHKVLLVAYKLNFDFSFLNRFLLGSLNDGVDLLDLLTVYKDRRPYPHKLKDAISAYALNDNVVNSHRAIDDCKAAFELLKAMDSEDHDLPEYINCFGYNPKYGVCPSTITNKARYVPQPYDCQDTAYEIDKRLTHDFFCFKNHLNCEEDSLAWISMGEKYYNSNEYMFACYCFLRVLSLSTADDTDASLAAFYIGCCYLYGKGFMQDIEKADEFFYRCYQLVACEEQIEYDVSYYIEHKKGVSIIPNKLYNELYALFANSWYYIDPNVKEARYIQEELLDCLTLNKKRTLEVQTEIYKCKTINELKEYFHLHIDHYIDFILFCCQKNKFVEKYREFCDEDTVYKNEQKLLYKVHEYDHIEEYITNVNNALRFCNYPTIDNKDIGIRNCTELKRYIVNNPYIDEAQKKYNAHIEEVRIQNEKDDEERKRKEAEEKQKITKEMNSQGGYEVLGIFSTHVNYQDSSGKVKVFLTKNRKPVIRNGYIFPLEEYNESKEKVPPTHSDSKQHEVSSKKDKNIKHTVHDYSQPAQNEYGYVSEEAIEDYEEYQRDWAAYMNEYE